MALGTCSGGQTRKRYQDGVARGCSLPCGSLRYPSISHCFYYKICLK